MNPVKIARAGTNFGLAAERKPEYDALRSDKERDEYLERHGHPWGKPPPDDAAPSGPAKEQTATVLNFEEQKAKRSSEPLDDDGDQRRSDMRKAVREYIKSELHCIQVAHHGKRPTNDSWRTERLTEEHVESLYGSPPMPNIGVQLGEASKGVCDVDLDWPLAPVIAEAITFRDLPSFGRAGKPQSHRLFKCIDLHGDDTALIKFDLPDSPCLKGRLPPEHELCVLEIRGNHQQTIFPPSVHSSGEQIAWDGGWRMPPERSWQTITELGGICAFLTFMATLYPPEGVRNDFSLALGGALCRALMHDKAYKDDDGALVQAVDAAVQVVCKLGGDRGHGRSWEQRAGNTLAKIKDGKPAWGLHKLCEILGLDNVIEQRLRQWLYADADADDRPVITYLDGKLGRVLESAQAALIDAGRPVYQRGGKLVSPVTLDKAENKNGIKRPAGSTLIRPLTSLAMRVHLTEAARWRMPGLKGFRWGAPSKEFAQTMLEYADNWKYPPLRGIAQTPIMRADGSILADEGYDADTGLLFNFGGVTYPKIPERPTREESLDALAKLKWLIKDFAFENDESRSVALSLILTAVVRRLLRTAPLHLIDAAEVGEGKTLLVDVASYIATGHEAALATWAAPEELEKRLVSYFMAGDAVINFDNISMPIGSDMFDAVLTHATFKPRKLGGNNVPLLPTNSTMAATGNNAKVKGDTPRRTIKGRLNSGHRTPWTRQAHEVKDLPAYILEHRPDIVAAVLTFMRGHAVSGAGIDDSLILGSFEDWSRCVRAALVWAGEADPVKTQEALLADNPTRNAMTMFAAAWRDCDALMDEPKRPEQIITASGNIQAEALRTALQALCPVALTALSLGHKLGEMIDKPLVLGDEVWRVRKFRVNGLAHYRLTKDAAQTEMAV
jgi:hypothetical protein